MKAKVFLDKKQDVHYEEHGVYADVNSKIAEWMEEYTNQRVIEELKNLPTLDTPLGELITISYYDVLTRIKQLNNK
jgi:hypothetical protein